MPAPPSLPPAPAALLVCVCDAQPEAAGYVQALQRHGYAVLHVELGELNQRVHEALPALVVCDVDAEGAVEALRQLHTTRETASVEILAVGAAGKTLTQHADAIALLSSGQFLRPVNTNVLVLTIETRIGAPPSLARGERELLSGSWMPPSVGEHTAAQTQLEISEPLAELLRAAEEHAQATLQAEPQLSFEDDVPRPQVIPQEALDALARPLIDEAVDGPRTSSGQGSLGFQLLRGSSAPPGADVFDEGPTSAAQEQEQAGWSDAPDEMTRNSGKVQTASDRPGARLPEWPSAAASDERATLPPPRLAPERAASTSSAPPVALRHLPQRLAEGDAVNALGDAVRARFSGALAFESDEGVRRVLFEEGDVVIAVSGLPGESLVGYLASIGELDAADAVSLEARLPAFGRHTGSALIARGKLRQEQLWTTLRQHAEWLLARIVNQPDGALQREQQVPERLADEPTVFGGATGAEVLIDTVRRAIEPALAAQRLGGARALIAQQPNAQLLTECALSAEESEALQAAVGLSVDQAAARSRLPDLASLLLALSALGVIDIRKTSARAPLEAPMAAPVPAQMTSDALRARIEARKALVDEGDYFTLLGVSPLATRYEIERAYRSLKHDFEPSRALTAATADLGDAVDTIGAVLDEAYSILVDDQRREVYRRAVWGAEPTNR